jgi:NAD(P)-dependent dehydrogenase (short-subunit alcohol dehydrogenase family)
MGDRVAGKVCVVTGAGSGSGGPRRSGWRGGSLVTCVDVVAEGVRETAEQIGEAAFVEVADVSDDAQVRGTRTGPSSGGAAWTSRSTTPG